MPALTLRIMNNTGICRNFLTSTLASVNADRLGMSESFFVIQVSSVCLKELTFAGMPVIEQERIPLPGALLCIFAHNNTPYVVIILHRGLFVCRPVGLQISTVHF